MSEALFAVGSDGAIRVLLGQPRQCGCGRMVALAVNRDGKTRCVECDENYLSVVAVSAQCRTASQSVPNARPA